MQNQTEALRRALHNEVLSWPERQQIIALFDTVSTKRALRESVNNLFSENDIQHISPILDETIDEVLHSLHHIPLPEENREVRLARWYCRDPRRAVQVVSLLLVLPFLLSGFLLMQVTAQKSAPVKRRILAEAELGAMKKFAVELPKYSLINEHVEEIKALAQTNAVKRTAEEVREAANKAIAAKDVVEAEKLVERLERVKEILKQQYVMDLVEDDSEAFGFKRTIKNKEGEDIEAYYLIVTTVNEMGEKVQLNIRDEATYQTKKVSRWAERVPKAAYERIRKERQYPKEFRSSSVFAVKRKGFLEPDITLQVKDRPMKRMGQLNTW